MSAVAHKPNSRAARAARAGDGFLSAREVDAIVREVEAFYSSQTSAARADLEQLTSSQTSAARADLEQLGESIATFNREISAAIEKTQQLTSSPARAARIARAARKLEQLVFPFACAHKATFARAGSALVGVCSLCGQRWESAR